MHFSVLAHSNQRCHSQWWVVCSLLAQGSAPPSPAACTTTGRLFLFVWASSSFSRNRKSSSFVIAHVATGDVAEHRGRSNGACEIPFRFVYSLQCSILREFAKGDINFGSSALPMATPPSRRRVCSCNVTSDACSSHRPSFTLRAKPVSSQLSRWKHLGSTEWAYDESPSLLKSSCTQRWRI